MIPGAGGLQKARLMSSSSGLRQVECSDRLLTVRMIASQLDMKKNSIW